MQMEGAKITFGPDETSHDLNEWKWVCSLFEGKIQVKDTQM